MSQNIMVRNVPHLLLNATARRVDAIVARAQAVGRAPTVVAAVLRNGALTHITAAGHGAAAAWDGAGAAWHGSGVAGLDPGTQFRIGSITKTMTAALVLAMRDEGRLGLDDPLDRHLPGTPFGDRSLRQLLCHVSGLQREPDGQWWERSAGSGTEDFLASLTAAKAAYPPHRTFHYSNLAYGLLGAVLTRITGQAWADLVTNRLLEPLGMRRTTYHPVEPYARGYVVHPWQETLHEEPRLDAGAMAAAGQLWSTIADLGNWASFLLDPKPSVLAPDSVAEMCNPAAINDLESWTSGQGLGVQLWRRGERVYFGHMGSMPGYVAVLAMHRRSATGVVVFANAYTLHGSIIGDLGCELLTTVLDAEPAPTPPWRPGAEPPPDARELTGRWWWMGREFEVHWDGELVVHGITQPGPAWRFSADGEDRWRCHSGSNESEVLQVRRADDGSIVALDIATFLFTRNPWPPV
jgi:CubicO group peptidase (beta-lactamase class C family)